MSKAKRICDYFEYGIEAFRHLAKDDDFFIHMAKVKSLGVPKGGAEAKTSITRVYGLICEGKTFSQVAEAEGVSQTRVRQISHRIFELMREYILIENEFYRKIFSHSCDVGYAEGYEKGYWEAQRISSKKYEKKFVAWEKDRLENANFRRKADKLKRLYLLFEEATELADKIKKLMIGF